MASSGRARRPSGRSATRQLPLHELQHRPPVEGVREGITTCHLLQLGPMCAILGDVQHLRDERCGLTALVPHDADRMLHPDLTTIRPQQSHLQRSCVGFAREQRRAQRRLGQQVAGMHDVIETVPQQPDFGASE